MFDTPISTARPLARLLPLALLLIATACQPAPNTLRATSNARYQAGDNLEWAQPTWDDTTWPHSPSIDLPGTPQVLWVRLQIPVSEVLTLGVSVAGVFAREIYWDGTLIGSSGRVGSDYASEEPGPIDAAFRVPDSLSAPGNHVLAIRLSSFLRPQSASGLLMRVVTGDLVELSVVPLRSVGIPRLFLGGFVLVALYFGALYFIDRRRLIYLLTGTLCAVVAGLLIAESWRDVIGYTYNLHTVRLAIVDTLTAAVGLLLCGTFALQFGLPGRRFVWAPIAAVLTLALVLALVLVGDHETGTYAAFAISLVAALGLTALAVWRRRPGARLALGAVAICLSVLVVTKLDFMEGAFFPAFGILVAGLLTSVGVQTRAERRHHAVALATASRLEAELLKKHLQPHFLMNTLTSIMELVETEQGLGARAIEALTAELRTLTDVSGEQLIPMARELALCRAHLDVMGFRRGVSFTLDAAGVDLEGAIPPAVIHTLIENAVTHNAYPEGETTFTLRESQSASRRRLTLSTPIAGRLCDPRPEGGGLRYIRARLEECAPGRWSLQSSAANDAWLTRIDLLPEVRS